MCVLLAYVSHYLESREELFDALELLEILGVQKLLHRFLVQRQLDFQIEFRSLSSQLIQPLELNVGFVAFDLSDASAELIKCVLLVNRISEFGVEVVEFQSVVNRRFVLLEFLVYLSVLGRANVEISYENIIGMQKSC